MESIAGVFQSRVAAEEGLAELLPLGIPKDRITVLTPEATEKELSAVPTVEAEQPGMGKPLGAAVGGAVGLASGMGCRCGDGRHCSRCGTGTCGGLGRSGFAGHDRCCCWGRYRKISLR